jgi:formylglycine-generating enzyme required for sulfatase activity
VNWDDVQEFISILNQLTGKKYRLPTEAEWEYAARGGSRSKGYQNSGSNNIGSIAWYTDNSGRKTHTVGSKSPNELGIYDMTGNVWEWCSDWYDANYYKSSPSNNPKGASKGIGSYKVLRGGGWGGVSRPFRVALRNSFPRSYRDNCFGFRLVLDSESPVPVPAPNPTPTTSGNDYGIKMVYVQGGTFTMGCTSEQSNCYDNEKPAHKVTLSSFSIGKYEVTQAQWRAVMGNNPSVFSGCDRCPVEYVNWDDAQKFILKLNQQTGKKYRLPTEAEWEYAARGGSRSKGYQYSGSNDVGAVAWCRDTGSKKTYKVGSKSPNELGIYDMSGNVSEWCNDWYDDNYYESSPSSNPKGASSGSYRVSRGGHWDNYFAEHCRVALRINSDPSARWYALGFRLVLEP